MRIDFRRTVLEQAVGEAAGARAHVGADAPAHVDGEGVQRSGELFTAPADEARLRLDRDFGVAVDARARLVD
ncbi:MAG: hypothetical protein U0521_23690 [Anaerolineae bacterium]